MTRFFGCLNQYPFLPEYITVVVKALSIFARAGYETGKFKINLQQ